MDFFGRFHPLLLHLPIGILVFAYLQWIFDIWKKKSEPTDLRFALSLGCITAIFSAWSGWILAGNGGYDQELLDWHKYLGIGTAVGSLVLLGAYYFKIGAKVFGVLFTGFMLLLGATGHYGGSLTHGKDFLIKNVSKDEVKKVSDIQEAHIFNDIVMPIFERKCVSCHNPEKSKGDLLFHNLEGWQKGGKHGEVLKAGFPTESHIIQRIALPKEEDEHMPPDGKLQLSLDEITFLEWWIKEMTNYDHLVKDLNPTTKVSKYLKSLEGDEFEGIEKVSASDLEVIRKYGIAATEVSASTPWIDISFKQKTDMKSSLKQLKKVAENITELDLSFSDISNSNLKILKQFTNLRKLNLSNTSIGNKGVKHLTNLEQLSYLNLYKTNVDNGVLNSISKLTNLKNVYLWQTKIDKTKAEQWASENPEVNVDLGVDVSIFGTPKLVSPTIEADSEIFKDSLLIALKINNPGATVKYSKKSNKSDQEYEYESPFYITESIELSTYLTQEGWTNSDTVKMTFTHINYEPESISITPQADDKYPGDGPSTLINFIKGSQSFGDGKWLGFQGSDMEAIIDLGQVNPIQSIGVGSLSDGRSYIFSPKSISVEVSVDGVEYIPFASKEYEIPSSFEAIQTKNHLLFSDSQPARFIKLKIESLKKNPDWHPAPGAPCWLFLDEVVVE